MNENQYFIECFMDHADSEILFMAVSEKDALDWLKENVPKELTLCNYVHNEEHGKHTYDVKSEGVIVGNLRVYPFYAKQPGNK